MEKVETPLRTSFVNRSVGGSMAAGTKHFEVPAVFCYINRVSQNPPHVKNRSYTPELLDADSIPSNDLFQNLKELNTINTLLGGHAVSLRGLKQFNLKKDTTYHILDIGCGGGDNLIYLAKWARKEGLNLQFTGVDLKADCLAYAKDQCKEFPEITFIHGDYRDLENMGKKYDICFSALFCHHFTEVDLRTLIRTQEKLSALGYFINDLHRHYLAYISIKFLSKMFSKSYLVKNDAPLSVQRAFKKIDFSAFLPVNNQNLSIQWAWAFRWLVVYKHG
jgi:2-polyprenyl-3-methyl-5-hydroxy-6-metoxy-1,4-benzoquinol methylase